MLKKPAPIREFSFFFILFYLIGFAFFSRLTLGKKDRNVSFVSLLPLFFTNPDNTFPSLKKLPVYFLFFAFVWLLYSLLIINSPLTGRFLNTDIFTALFAVWLSGVFFIFIKSFITLFAGYLFSIPGFGLSYVVVELKVWIAFSLLIFLFAILQLNPDIPLPGNFILFLASLPLAIIFIQKFILLYSLKEYSWFIKILYLCSVELLLVFIFIELIIRFL